MSSLRDRIEDADGQAVIKDSRGVTVSRVITGLEAGTAAGALGEELGLTAEGFLAALVHAALGDSSKGGPDLVQRPPSHPKLGKALTLRVLETLIPGRPKPLGLALLAGLLQIHDFWDESHQAAQEADDLGEREFSAYWHGIAHRREPDAGNASYWFRRVGRHPLSPILAADALPLLEEFGDERLRSNLIPEPGEWNSSAMISLCTRARPGSREAALARRLQCLEMQLLIDATASAMLSKRAD